MTESVPVIAIDGPSASGKGTIDVDTSNFVVVTVSWQTLDSADHPVHSYVSRTQITR